MSAAAVSPTSAQDNALRTRRVWKGDIGNICCHVFPKPSPDGRYVPGVDWFTGDLAYLDLQEDRWIRVTDKGPWQESSNFSMNALFSPDGSQAVHTWFTLEGTEALFELRVQDLNGENERVLIPPTVSAYAWPLDWSPNGRFVLAVLTPEATETQFAVQMQGMRRVTLVSVDGGEVQVLKELDPAVNSGNPTARFSPDGEWIAYETFTGDPPFYDIHLLSADGSVDRPLLTGNGDDRLLDWLPDGTGILAHSERNLSQGIWRHSVQDGRPVGSPELVKGDVWGILGMGFGSAGLYYMVPTEAPQVYTATLDLDRGELTSSPNPVREITDGAGTYPSWSPDGRQLAFVDRGPPGATRSLLVIESLETGESHTLSVPIEGLMNLQWDPDGRTVTGIGTHEGAMGFHRFDLQTGEVETLFDAGLGPGNHRLSRDGATLLYTPPTKDNQVEIRVLDLETGTERVVGTLAGEIGLVTDFPGGGRYVVLTGSFSEPDRFRLVTMNSDGTGIRTYWDGPKEFPGVPTVEVSPDGRHILLGASSPSGEKFFFSFDVETGERREIDLGTGGELGGPWRNFTLHPDGSRIAFWTGEAKGEIWVMEGLQK
jgi:Tol biopolymer transport system component